MDENLVNLVFSYFSNKNSFPDFEEKKSALKNYAQQFQSSGDITFDLITCNTHFQQIMDDVNIKPFLHDKKDQKITTHDIILFSLYDIGEYYYNQLHDQFKHSDDNEQCNIYQTYYSFRTDYYDKHEKDPNLLFDIKDFEKRTWEIIGKHGADILSYFWSD